ncbi:MAG: bifunctional 23S rRNA (guanine(2069)-N(7))-methyltransferase RlmK/23S rRNA (guanine(2445)-N(2))-methyltransferase RlmL [Desulfuromonas sp.]|nr:MAG: bifunctional 23S rRNA (guanine(2069)-N(7))-methyltransferase RlmK/23S rRNA (guanine(2445)-N(2))-methyltransferase RlmL [Desulfuromonas sp.]
MSSETTYFVSAAVGFEGLLLDELRQLGASAVKESRAGVYAEGSLAFAYRVLLESHLASRLLLPLATFAAPDPEALYAGVQTIRWQEHLLPTGSLAVDAVVNRSKLRHSGFAALKVKDAIVDQLRDACGERPSVDTEHPDLRIHLYLAKDEATISLDLSGESLHRRGYRVPGGTAPLKESLAAAILLRAGWPEIAAAGGPLLDPMCGTGTLLIEGALLAGKMPPGARRERFGVEQWRGHDAALWERLRQEATARWEAGKESLPSFYGYDADPAVIRVARECVERAGLSTIIHLERRELARLEPVNSKAPGLLVVNPPYGERLGDVRELRHLYAALGGALRRDFQGWKAALFTGNPDLARDMGLRAHRYHSFHSGPIPCRLFHFDVDPERVVGATARQNRTPEADTPLSEGAQMFANRLRKNLKSLGRWARKDGVSCYRLYDADMPEYAVAIDLYGDRVHVQEYAPPETVDARRAKQRLDEVMAALAPTLGIPAERIFLKVRQRQKGAAQYHKLASEDEFFDVQEGRARLLVNLTDYLDTGLFLDHRPTRLMLGEMAKGKRFLNLFAYTGAATVHAALGGARSTTTVDLSRTYLGWARRNMALNGFSDQRHRFIQADCRSWIDEAQEPFDLIFLDPPTFSNSKSMDDSFDVLRDHVPLLRATARLLAPGGELIFSNNHRRFRMDRDALPELDIEEISAATLPPDFARNPRIHNCWRILRRERRR